MSMSVLHVIATAGPGGAEALVAYVAAAQQRQGCDVAVYLLAGARGDRGEYLLRLMRSSGVKVYGAEPRSAWSILNLFSVAWILLKYRYKVVHAHLFSAEVVCLIASTLVPFRGRALVRTLHSVDIIGSRNRWLVKVMDRFYPVSIACADPVRSAYLALYDGHPRTHLTVIKNGIQPPALRISDADKIEARRALRIPPEAYVVLHIGAFRGGPAGEVMKGQDVAVRAFRELSKKVPNSILYLVGDGPTRKLVMSLVRSMGLEGKAHLTGSVPDPSIYLNAADVFIFPSRKEGLPLSILEAAMHGLPIVGSDIPEIACLNHSYPWLLSPVDDVDAYANALLHFFNTRGTVFQDYDVDVVQRYGISMTSSGYIEAYRLFSSR